MDEKIELKIYDWNRVSSNKSLGSYVLDPSKVNINTYTDQWVQVDKQGELRIAFHFTPATLDTPKKFNVKPEPFRMTLERTEFWPGDIVRGVLVWNVSKPVKIHHLRLIAEGSTRASYSTGNNGGDHYVAEVCTSNTSATLLGSAEEGKSSELVVAPGEYLYPFEYTLPMNLSQTCYNLGIDGVRFGIGAFADVIGKSNLSCLVYVHIRWHPNQARPEQQLPCEDEITKEREVKAEVTCAATAYVGEEFDLNVVIENKSKKVVTHYIIDLEQRWFTCARSNWGSGSRSISDFEVKCSWTFNRPLDVGRTYGERVRIGALPDVPLSLHSTKSPLLQNAYRFNIRVFTSADSTIKTYGKTSAPILLGNRYIHSYIAPVPQSPASENAGKFLCAPAPCDCSFWVVPGRNETDIAWNGARQMPRIATLAGQYVPPNQTSDRNKVFLSTENSYARPHVADWNPGSVPRWISGNTGLQASEGVAPANDAILAAFYQ